MEGGDTWICLAVAEFEVPVSSRGLVKQSNYFTDPERQGLGESPHRTYTPNKTLYRISFPE